jgi:hypothetical protein
LASRAAKASKQAQIASDFIGLRPAYPSNAARANDWHPVYRPVLTDIEISFMRIVPPRHTCDEYVTERR